LIWLLDTNAFSALMGGAPEVVRRARSKSPASLLVPQPVLAEVAYGIARLPRSRRKTRFERLFARVRAELRRVEWTDDVSLRFGRIKANLERRGLGIEDFDVAIAAHAMAADATLVTANAKHFARIDGLTIEDWTLPL
jgi:tRNA(fMet)-specific endonuclease VapC